MADDPALTALFKKTNLNKLNDSDVTKPVFTLLKDFFANAINTSIAVNCASLPCGARTRTNGPPPPGSDIIPYPYPAPLKKPDDKIASLEHAPDALAAFDTTYIRAEPITYSRRLGFLEAIEERSEPVLSPFGVGAVLLGELTPKTNVAIADNASADLGVVLAKDDAAAPRADVPKTCKAFYGPVTAVGAGRINFTLTLSVTVPGPPPITATLAITADGGMSVETLSIHIDGGPCDPPTCADETKLRADVLVKFWGNLNISASVAVTLPILGTIGGGASVTKFGITCEERVEREAVC